MEKNKKVKSITSTNTPNKKTEEKKLKDDISPENDKNITEKNSNEDIVENEIKEQIVENNNEINFEHIKNEIESHNKIPLEEIIKIKRKVIPNIIIALSLILFYIFIELGYKNIETINYVLDLKVFSGIFLITSIYLFEKSYKLDEFKKMVFGIEMLIVSIFNLSLIYVYYAYSRSYESIVFIFALIIGIYYFIKSITIFLKNKKEYFFEKSDIKKIVSK